MIPGTYSTSARLHEASRKWLVWGLEMQKHNGKEMCHAIVHASRTVDGVLVISALNLHSTTIPHLLQPKHLFAGLTEIGGPMQPVSIV